MEFLFMIKEWDLLRVIACLSIVFLHSTTNVAGVAGHVYIDGYQFLRAFLCFATPTFIILSEVILAYRYSEKLPNNFWSKRFKYLYIPFLVFAVIDAIVSNHLTPSIVVHERFIQNLFSGIYSGWFVLVIFQFYFLHFLLTKWKVSMKTLIPISIIIMYIHLFLIKSNIPFVQKHSLVIFLPFTAWFGYFTIAHVIGRYYDNIRNKLLKYKWILLLGTILTFFLIWFSYFELDYRNINSRRLDLFPFVIFFSLTIMAFGQYIPYFKITRFLSSYSYGIYLVHWQIQRLIAPYIVPLSDKTLIQVILMFLVSLLLTIIFIKLVSILPFGAFIVGRTKRTIKPTIGEEKSATL